MIKRRVKQQLSSLLVPNQVPHKVVLLPHKVKAFLLPKILPKIPPKAEPPSGSKERTNEDSWSDEEAGAADHNKLDGGLAEERVVCIYIFGLEGRIDGTSHIAFDKVAFHYCNTSNQTSTPKLIQNDPHRAVVSPLSLCRFENAHTPGVALRSAGGSQGNLLQVATTAELPEMTRALRKGSCRSSPFLASARCDSNY